jgi:hypothetical protein
LRISRHSARALGLIVCGVLLSCYVLAQTPQKLPPVPADPLELANGPVTIPSTADERAAAIALLERARQNFTLRSPGSAPYDLKVSFLASGGTSYSGSGEMEDLWESPGHVRWTARLANYSETRVFQGGYAWDADPHAYIPLRVHMLRQLLLWPLNQIFTNAQIRTAPAAWNGAAVTCVLISFGRAETIAEPGRQWQEEEFCIDPKSGLLQTYSVSPGMYNVYNYSNAVNFHGRIVPRQLSVVVSGTPVLQAQVEIADLGQVDASTFKPAEGWTGPAIVIRGPTRFSMAMPQAGETASDTQPIIVHALLGVDGKVLEAEALQNSDAARAQAAVQLVSGTRFGQAQGPFQREVFIRLGRMIATPFTPPSSQ